MGWLFRGAPDQFGHDNLQSQCCPFGCRMGRIVGGHAATSHQVVAALFVVASAILPYFLLCEKVNMILRELQNEAAKDPNVTKNFKGCTEENESLTNTFTYEKLKICV